MRAEFHVFRQSLGWHGRDKEVQKWLNGQSNATAVLPRANQEVTLLSEI